MNATPAAFAETMSRTDDAKLLRRRMDACRWFLGSSERRLAHLASNGASEASLQAERLSIARHAAAMAAIGAKLQASGGLL